MAKYIKKFNIKNSTLNNNDNIFYVHFETILNNNQQYLTCYSISQYRKNEGAIIVKSKIIDVFNDVFSLKVNSTLLLDSFFKDIFELLKTNNFSLVYFHNLGKFNGIFLINYFIDSNDLKMEIITRDSTIYEIIFKDKHNKKIKIRDSYLLFPSSLNKMSKIFCNEDKFFYDNHKVNLNDYFNPEFRNIVMESCSNDSVILAKAFNKYRQLISEQFQIDITSCITLSSLAFKIFRSKYYIKDTIQQSHGHMDSFIRKSYRGGVVDVYKPQIKNGYYYDVNSLYPYIMSTSYMPVGIGKFGNAKLENNFNINNFFGFIYVKVKCPDSLYIPFLTVNHSKYGLISPVGEWKDVYFSEEIKYALTLGYEFEYYVYYEFNKEIIFDNYVTDIYKQRVINKDRKDLSTILKLLLNSLYGRFGMANSLYKTILLRYPEETEYFDQLNLIYDIQKMGNFKKDLSKLHLIRFDEIPNLYHIKKLYDCNMIDDSLYNKLLKESSIKTSNLNVAVHIASAITAYSRIYMHKIKNKYAENLYYSDTDSLITDKKLNNDLVSDDQIGLLKLEYKIESGLFIAPKLYYIKTNLGDISKSKGVDATLLSFEDFLKLYEGECIKINTIRYFLRKFEKYTINISNLEIKLNGVFTKREKIFKNNIWSDTRPIKIQTTN